MILTHANHSFVNACRASPSKRFCVADCEAGQLHCKPLSEVPPCQTARSTRTGSRVAKRAIAALNIYGAEREDGEKAQPRCPKLRALGPLPSDCLYRLKTTNIARMNPAYSAHTPTSVSSPFLKGLGSGTAGGTWASSQTTAVRFLRLASERCSDATLAKALTVWVAFFRSVPR